MQRNTEPPGSSRRIGSDDIVRPPRLPNTYEAPGCQAVGAWSLILTFAIWIGRDTGNSREALGILLTFLQILRHPITAGVA